MCYFLFMATKAAKAKKTPLKKEPSVVEEALVQSVGIRELRQNASRVLDLVKSGEKIIVTERGKPIAEIVPIKRDKVQELMDLGAITPALRPFNPDVWYRSEGPFYPNALEQFLKERHEARY
jgi:prevent-host-death family protein